GDDLLFHLLEPLSNLPGEISQPFEVILESIHELENWRPGHLAAVGAIPYSTLLNGQLELARRAPYGGQVDISNHREWRIGEERLNCLELVPNLVNVLAESLPYLEELEEARNELAGRNQLALDNVDALQCLEIARTRDLEAYGRDPKGRATRGD